MSDQEWLTIIGIGVTCGLFFLGSVLSFLGWFVKRWIKQASENLNSLPIIQKQLAVVLSRIDRHEKDIEWLKGRVE